MHAVQRLFAYRQSLSTRPFLSRGAGVDRCEQCRISRKFCICPYLPEMASNAGFLLLMYDDEVLKPSNTARLIADLVDDTYAYLWSRTSPDPEMLAVLKEPGWQPYLVFPEQYAWPQQPVVKQVPAVQPGKRPLFVVLDGSWRETKKMFRKSPYLANLPMLSFDLSRLGKTAGDGSRYQIRKSEVDNHLATAEVAACALDACGEHDNAQLMHLWFEVFSYQYQQGVCKTNKGDPHALENLQQYIGDKDQ